MRICECVLAQVWMHHGLLWARKRRCSTLDNHYHYSTIMIDMSSISVPWCICIAVFWLTTDWVLPWRLTRIRACEWFMSHMWMGHGTRVDESWQTYGWVIAHIWMSHGTHMDESWHTFSNAMTIRYLHIYTHTQTHLHTHRHRHTHIHKQLQIHIQMNAYHTHTLTHTLNSHAHAHAHTHTQTNTYTHIHECSPASAFLRFWIVSSPAEPCVVWCVKCRHALSKALFTTRIESHLQCVAVCCSVL